MINEDILIEIKNHALQDSPNESCGVIIVKKGKEVYIPCKNIAINKTNDFIINPEDYAGAEDIGDITYIVHSHPISEPIPSQTDLISIEKNNIPWIIINPGTGKYTITNPSLFKLPLVGREFKHGLIDCYTLVRDYYNEVLNIKLKDYKRPDEWWNKTNLNLYIDHYQDEGFIQVLDGSLQEHDLIFMRVGSDRDNHAAIYIGNNMILHHPMNRLSSRDIYGGWWQKITSIVIRHKDLI